MDLQCGASSNSKNFPSFTRSSFLWQLVSLQWSFCISLIWKPSPSERSYSLLTGFLGCAFRSVQMEVSCPILWQEATQTNWSQSEQQNDRTRYRFAGMGSFKSLYFLSDRNLCKIFTKDIRPRLPHSRDVLFHSSRSEFQYR